MLPTINALLICLGLDGVLLRIPLHSGKMENGEIVRNIAQKKNVRKNINPDSFFLEYLFKKIQPSGYNSLE